MTKHNSTGATLEDVVRDYIEMHGGTRAISTSEAIQTIRTMFPTRSFEDRELADKIAEAAMLSGYAVDFDAPKNSVARSRS